MLWIKEQMDIREQLMGAETVKRQWLYVVWQGKKGAPCTEAEKAGI